MESDKDIVFFSFMGNNLIRMKKLKKCKKVMGRVMKEYIVWYKNKFYIMLSWMFNCICLYLNNCCFIECWCVKLGKVVRNILIIWLYILYIYVIGYMLSFGLI